MTKKTKKIAVASASLVLAGAVTGLVAASNYFINYAILRPEPTDPQAGDDPLAPSFELSDTEEQAKAYYKEAVAQWQTDHTPVERERTSPDGLTLWAKEIRQPQPSDLWVVAVHGYLSEHGSMEDITYEYFQRGYNVLLPDLRGHGNSQGDYVGMGLHDADDIIDWVTLLSEENPGANFVLHGVSMGAATVMIAAGKEHLPENVFAIVEDCGYTDSYQMMVEQLNYRYHLPGFPIVPMANFMAEFRTNYDLRDANPLDYLQSATLPILFIHGDQDNFVLPYMHTQLVEAYQGPKESLIIPGADHGACRTLDSHTYYTTVFQFLEKYPPQTKPQENAQEQPPAP